MAKNIVIFLHGVGSRGSHLEPILDYWKSKMPEVIFAAPNAPFPFAGGGDGFEWFSLNAISEQNRPQRVLEAREHFDNTLNQVWLSMALRLSTTMSFWSAFPKVPS
ncbi:alpha/beta hydrolase [Vibrio olivae]